MSAYRRVIKSEEVILVENNNADNKGGVNLKSDSDPEYFKKTFSKEIGRIEKQAFQKGLSDGIKKGKDIQRQEASQMISALSSLIQELSELKQKTLLDSEEQMLELSLAVAQKIIHTECDERRDVVQKVLREAIRNIVDRENMKIRINPEDLQYMTAIKNEFLSTLEGIRNVVFEKDETIGRGGAVIEARFGEVDARIDQQFNEIRSALTASTK